MPDEIELKNEPEITSAESSALHEFETSSVAGEIHDENSRTEIPRAENNPAKLVSDKNPAGEKIRLAGDPVLEKFKIVRRGRGRPKNDGSPKISDVVEDSPVAVRLAAPPVSSPVAVPAAPVAAAAAVQNFEQEINNLFRKVIAGGAKGVTEGLNNVTKVLANTAKIDAAFTEKTLAASKPSDDALDDFAASVDLVVRIEKPQIKKGGHWACLGISSARLLAPYAMIWWEFKNEIARNRAKENQK